MPTTTQKMTKTEQGWVPAPTDRSILGFSRAEIDAMEPEERLNVLYELLNQAGDLAREIQTAFAADLLGLDGGAVGRAADELIWTARRIE